MKMSKRKRNSKRGQNEGSIYLRKDGRWTAVINLGYQGGKLKRKSFYGKTREDVQKSLTKALHDHQQGLPVAMPRQTVKQFLERWLEDCVKPTVRPATYVSYEQQVRVHIAPALGHHQLTKLGPQHIQAYMNEKAKPVPQPGKDKPKPGLSTKTIGYHRSLLVMAIGQALKWGLVVRNVATLVDKPRALKYEIQPITSEQARQFLEVIKGNRLEALFTVALSLGLRRGEALGLRWQDI